MGKTKITNFPRKVRDYIASFVIESRAFAGLGHGLKPHLNDFYLFDSKDNTWQHIDVFSRLPGSSAVAFAAENKGLVGT